MNETLRLSVPAEAGPLSTDDVAHYARTGWVAARGFYSPEEAQAISRWTNELVAAPEVPGRHMVYREDSLLRSGERVIQRIENFCPFHQGRRGRTSPASATAAAPGAAATTRGAWTGATP